ncbi:MULTISPECIES: urease accessory protein UreD [unclassified Devosia]|uniref:urease accessory protein UreD n=1 Tax=unclassified Devosia TaxID=196773 RepID=UPI00145D8DC3|nr:MULTISPECIES: urease accessory protein UreD [unclassified Devosia]MBJ6986656.1 urease accessory protein UreD [Devosia sp. MC521]QMW61692.1 urease accessory protein UreD [Devosia sp. MC521]
MSAITAEKLIYADLQRARGIGRVSTKQFGGRTHLASLYQDGCAKIRLPKTHSQSLEAVLINTAGGITGGDQIEWEASVEADGHLVLTTQACERSYRSTGQTARIQTTLEVGQNAHLDWLPQETILFEASKLSRRLNIHLAEGATLTAIEAILLGREAMGEDARDAELSDNWRIYRCGRLIHAEATKLTGTAAERDANALLSGARAFASIVHITKTSDEADRIADRLRAIIAPHSRTAISANGERIVLRAAAPSGIELRRNIVPILANLTATGTLPRLWHL